MESGNKVFRARYALGAPPFLLALLLVAGNSRSQEQPRTFRIPFHTVNGLILLDATVNGKEARFVLDTGAAHTANKPTSAPATAIWRAVQERSIVVTGKTVKDLHGGRDATRRRFAGFGNGLQNGGSVTLKAGRLPRRVLRFGNEVFLRKGKQDG